MTPKELVLQIHNDVARDCHYTEIIYKVIAAFPDIKSPIIGECEDYAYEVHRDACVRFEAEHVSFFDTDVRDFKMRCQELVYSVCVNKFFRDEMYEMAVESDVFADRFYSLSGKNSDYGNACWEDFESE